MHYEILENVQAGFIYFKNYHIVPILDEKIGYRAHEVDVALETFLKIKKIYFRLSFSKIFKVKNVNIPG